MTLDVERVEEHRFVGRNERGARVQIGRKGQEGTFSPTELLQLAVAGCAAVTGEALILRRIGDEAPIRAEVSARQRPDAHELDGIDVRFDLDLSALDADGVAELAATVDRAVDRLCTVSRTLRKGIPVRETYGEDAAPTSPA